MPKRKAEEISQDLQQAVRDNNVGLLLNLLKDKDVQDFLKKLSPKDYLMNVTTFATMCGNLRVICELADYIPHTILDNAIFKPVFTKQQPLLFSRLQRHANTLSYLGLPEECINNIFNFACDGRDAISKSKMLEAADGTQKASNHENTRTKSRDVRSNRRMFSCFPF